MSAMDDQERLCAAADELATATEALREIDLNVLLDDEVRALLDAKDDLSAVCHRLREDQHAARRRQEEGDDDE